MAIRTALSALLPSLLLSLTLVADPPAAQAAQAVPVRVMVESTATRDVYANPDGTFTADLKIAPASDFPPGRTGWGIVLSGVGYANRSFWGGDFEHIAKVGLCPEHFNPWQECGSPSIGVARSYFQYDASFLLGRRVLKAEFNTFLQYTPSCDAAQMQVWGTNPVDGGLTWNNQPFPGGGPTHLGSDHVTGGYNSRCPGLRLGYTATQAVLNSLQFSGGRTAIMIKAGLEAGIDGEYAWKKFLVNGEMPELSVTYNSYPDRPTGLTAEGKACAQAPNEPYVNPFIDNDPAKGPRGPQLAARATDPDGGLLYTQFQWRTRGGGLAGVSNTVGKASGSTFTIDVPSAAAADGAKLSYRAVGANRVVEGGTDYGIDYGPWAPSNDTWCDVTIDRTAPNAPPTIVSADYPECRFESCPIGGGIGRTGAFTLNRNGVADVAGFRFDLHDQPSTFIPITADGSAQALVTPPDDGPMDLFVRSVDKAGNVGPLQRYHFYVGPGTPANGQWRLDGLDETAVLDDSSNHHDGTITLGPASWRVGRHGDALWLNGTTSAFVNTGNGRTVDTTKSFTVAAWVNLEQMGTFRTAVSQDGGQISGFFLQYNPTTGKWDFMMPTNNADNPTGMIRASSTVQARTNRWTHLVGSYDAGSRQIRLYVDGALNGTTGFTTPWSATGTVQLGRGKYRGGYVDPWPGLLDDVRVYDRVLSVEEVRRLATTPAVEELFLPLDEGGVDVSGNYRTGTLGAGTSWVPGKVGSRAVHFDGQTGAGISTGTPVVRTDNSFTVSAWVKADVLDAGARTAVSQDGVSNSGFYLGYRGDTDKWTLLLLDSDGSGAVRAEAPQTPSTGEWTHLTGVYDAAARQIRLYVGGALAAEVSYLAPRWNATGPLMIGRAKYQNRFVDYWHGAVDDVHLWTGVRTADQIQDDFLHPVTKRTSAYTGQLSRYQNAAGDHVVTTEPVPPGSHFEASMGLMAPAGAANTVTVHSCRNGAIDFFLAHGGCADYTDLGPIGQLYRSPPAVDDTVAVYACAIAGRSHFNSHDPNCEGRTVVGVLGFSRAYAQLVSSNSAARDEQMSSIYQVPADYVPSGGLGLVGTRQLPGTTGLWICRDGTDTFTSNQADCEDRTVVRSTGQIWTSPPANVTASAELFRCRTSTGDRFDSQRVDCLGHTFERSLGFVVTEL